MPSKWLYVDTSALVKLVLSEVESAALRQFMMRWPRRTASKLVRVELYRAVRRISTQAPVLARTERVLAALSFLDFTEHILNEAGALSPPEMRTLDAIHLASALSIGSALGGMVTYDHRLATEAQIRGIAVFQPR